MLLEEVDGRGNGSLKRNRVLSKVHKTVGLCRVRKNTNEIIAGTSLYPEQQIGGRNCPRMNKSQMVAMTEEKQNLFEGCG